MIITAIRGGFGNQLFQFAFAHYMKAQVNDTIVFDLFPLQYGDQTKRPFLLNELDIKIETCNKQLHNVFTTLNDGLLNKFFKKIKRQLQHYIYIHENTFDEYKIKNRQSGIYYMDGYWQNYKYAAFAQYIINELLNKKYTIEKDLAGFILSKNSVAVHIRRGDYISNVSANKIHGIISIEYYHTAIKLLKEKYIDCNFIIFSDDINWCKDNIKSECPIHFHEGNTDLPIYDLYLMKNCKHQIIANSSFSYWAAVLNTNENKTVILPRKWTVKDYTSDLKLYNKQWTIL